jgi:hypothetical protein
MSVAAYLIWRHEGAGADRRPGGASPSSAEGGEGVADGGKRRPPGVLYDDEAWRPCLGDILRLLAGPLPRRRHAEEERHCGAPARRIQQQCRSRG